MSNHGYIRLSKFPLFVGKILVNCSTVFEVEAEERLNGQQPQVLYMRANGRCGTHSWKLMIVPPE
jgi:hypothetical protein